MAVVSYISMRQYTGILAASLYVELEAIEKKKENAFCFFRWLAGSVPPSGPRSADRTENHHQFVYRAVQYGWLPIEIHETDFTIILSH